MGTILEDAEAAALDTLANVLAEARRRRLDELPLDLTVQVAGAAARLRATGAELAEVLQLALAVVDVSAEETRRPGHRLLERALVVAVAQAYSESEMADLKDQQQELRALVRVSREVNLTLDPVRVAETGLGETLDAMRLDAGGIWLYGGGGRRLELIHTAGVPEPVRAALQPIDVGLDPRVAAAMRTGEPFQMSLNPANPALAAYRSALLVPLRGHHGPLGLLAVGTRHERSFRDAEVSFVGAVADHLGAALDHAFEHRREAHTDYLTGLANRSEFEAALRRQVAIAGRHRRRVSLMLLDLDLLKRINDSRGHHAGDDAIRIVAAVIRKTVRTSDLSARIGGDEFAVLMPESEEEQAREVAERIQAGLAKHDGVARFGFKLELSLGIAEWHPGQSARDLFEAADAMLYQDKRRHQARRARQASRDAKLGGSKRSSRPLSSPATPSR